jgi:hypothetical protein
MSSASSVEFVDQQPRRLRWVGGLLAHCDARGRVDQRRQREGMRLALEGVWADVLPWPTGKVCSLAGRRAGQRFHEEYQFEPTRRAVEARLEHLDSLRRIVPARASPRPHRTTPKSWAPRIPPRAVLDTLRADGAGLGSREAVTQGERCLPAPHGTRPRRGFMSTSMKRPPVSSEPGVCGVSPLPSVPRQRSRRPTAPARCGHPSIRARQGRAGLAGA